MECIVRFVYGVRFVRYRVRFVLSLVMLHVEATETLSLSLWVLKFGFIFWADCQGCWFWSCQSTNWIRGDDSWNRDISTDGSGGMKSITLCLISHSLTHLLTLTIYFWDPGDWTQTLQSQSRCLQLWDSDMGTFDWSCKSSAYNSFSELFYMLTKDTLTKL